MVNSKYAKAYTEVLEVIKYFPEEYYNKIPKTKIEFYKENRDKNYKFVINPDIDLSEQKLSEEANAIIVMLYRDYFATAEQKKKIIEILELNEKISEKEKREKYDPNGLFVKNSNQINTGKDEKEVALVEYKEGYFTRFKKFIMKLLNIKK